MKQLLLTLFLICPIAGFSQTDVFGNTKTSDRIIFGNHSVNYTISYNARTPFIKKTQDRIIRSKQLNTNRRMAFGVPKSGRRLITYNKFMRRHKRRFKG